MSNFLILCGFWYHWNTKLLNLVTYLDTIRMTKDASLRQSMPTGLTLCGLQLYPPHISSWDIIVAQVSDCQLACLFGLCFSKVSVCMRCGQKSNKMRRMNIISIWRKESWFSMRSLEDKTCCLKCTKQR